MMRMSRPGPDPQHRWNAGAPAGLPLLFLSGGEGTLARNAARFASSVAHGQLRVSAGSFAAPGPRIADAGLVVMIGTPHDALPPLLHEGGRVEWMVGADDVALLQGHVRGLLGDLRSAGLLPSQRAAIRPARLG